MILTANIASLICYCGQPHRTMMRHPHISVIMCVLILRTMTKVYVVLMSCNYLSLQVSKDELAKLAQGFEKQELLTSGGVTLAGQRYIYLSGTDRVVRAKLGKIGVHCMKTQQGKHILVRVFAHIMRFFLIVLSPPLWLLCTPFGQPKTSSLAEVDHTRMLSISI